MYDPTLNKEYIKNK